ncbi:MAG: YneF family protein [Acholeplasmatales bacterium]|nr:YneF family protein [Acholeplasmatales bacterium]
MNRDMIRAMFMQMGRKPSEKDITRVMNSMNQYK